MNPSVPSDIPGNELVNTSITEATTITTNAILPVFLNSSLELINGKICLNPPTHEQVAQIH